MTITRHNCEAAFLDYYEKNLSPVEVAEMLFFLEENPDLKEVFEAYEEIYLEHEKINFPDKESLKKKYSREELDAVLAAEITRANCEQFFIADMEGILSAGQKEKLNLFLLQYPELKKEFEIFHRCKLVADKISFAGKEALKKEFLKRGKRKPVFVSIFSRSATYYAAAAAILLLIGLFFFFGNNETDRQMLLADKTNPVSMMQKGASLNNRTTEQPNNRTTEQSSNRTIEQSSNRTIEQPNNRIAKPSKTRNGKRTISKGEKYMQPVIIEEEENLIAKEEVPLPMMKEEIIAKAKQKEEKDEKEGAIILNQTLASADKVKESMDIYQTLGSFARKKIRSFLGIKPSAGCETSDKITLWDLTMAAKAGVQKIMGTTAVDVNKVCDGSGDKVEYVFTAGNFEISRSAAK